MVSSIGPQTQSKGQGKASILLMCCAVLATWPVIAWSASRYADRSDDPLGIIALVTFAGIFGLRLVDTLKTNRSTIRIGRPASNIPMMLLLLLAYGVALLCLPKAIQAVLGLTVLGYAFSGVCAVGLRFADWCMLYLALPIVSSLNFFVSYPLRLLIAECSSVWLKLIGFDVTTDGVQLQWQQCRVGVDPPCSGVKMLWFASFLACAVAGLFGLRTRGTIFLLLIAVAGAVVANVFRVASIFLVELPDANLGGMPIPAGFSHDVVGGAVYFLLTLIVLLAAVRISKRNQSPVTLPDETKTPSCLNIIWHRLNLFNSSRHLLVFGIPLVTVAVAAIPLVHFQTENVARTNSFAGWPTQFEGKTLTQIKDTPEMMEFAKGFPGRVGVFSNGKEIICMRWISSETRQVHPASDCYRGLGYDITYRSSRSDDQGKQWSIFEARKGSKQVEVRERVFDSSGQSWDDVSAWYWAAVLGKTKPSWWSVTVSRRLG